MKVRLSDDVVWRELDDKIVIIDSATNQYFGLSGAGGVMWRLLAEHGSTEAALAGLQDEFDADAEQLRADLDALVKDLAEKGLLVAIADAPNAARKRRARR
jgi:hypothetical protein